MLSGYIHKYCKYEYIPKDLLFLILSFYKLLDKWDESLLSSKYVKLKYGIAKSLLIKKKVYIFGTLFATFTGKYIWKICLRNESKYDTIYKYMDCIIGLIDSKKNYKKNKW